VTEPASAARGYGGTVAIHGVLAVLIVVIAVATGGTFLRALAFAAGFFVLANAWSLALRARERRRGG
jgi:hypothetical protein